MGEVHPARREARATTIRVHDEAQSLFSNYNRPSTAIVSFGEAEEHVRSYHEHTAVTYARLLSSTTFRRKAILLCTIRRMMLDDDTARDMGPRVVYLRLYHSPKTHKRVRSGRVSGLMACDSQHLLDWA